MMAAMPDQQQFPRYDYCGATQVCSQKSGHRGHHGGFRWPEIVAPKRQPPHAVTRLTPAQYEIVLRLAEGQLIHSIMRDLHIAYNTLDNHRRQAMERYDVDSIHRLWMALGWLVLPERAA